MDTSMSWNAPPRVTIGMPVYNGGDGLGHVIESILGQTYKNLKLVISDNASSDQTESICREFEAHDDRVIYIRQAKNIGAEANFDFVLSKANTEYFMWAAADDLRSREFIEKNIAFLDRNLDFLASTCPVRFAGSEFDPIWMGDQTRDEADPFVRMLNFFQLWHANGRFYSLFRTNALHALKSPRRSYLGSDWTIVVELLQKGKFKRLDSGFLELGRHGLSNSPDIFARYRNRTICWLLPMIDFSLTIVPLFARASFKYKVRILLILLKANLITFKWQIKFELKRTYSRFTSGGKSVTSVCGLKT